VCNLGSINLGEHLLIDIDAQQTDVDWDKLRATVRTAITFLDRVIEVNYYPSIQAAASTRAGARSGLV